ncbi:hypothetical protein WCLP8_4410009 [uncultured Gammaproteobacteria bacterium]
MRQKLAIVMMSSALALGGCGGSWKEFSNTAIGLNSTMVTTADVRVITEREVSGRKIMCTEPSPDVAKALSTALEVSANVTGSGEGKLGYAYTEQLAQLTVRVPAIQALRDGLFRACEAYANGAIGDAAYALIISRYGDLLVTLLLGEGAASSPAVALVTLQGMNLRKPSDTSATNPVVSDAGKGAPAPSKEETDKSSPEKAKAQGTLPPNSQAPSTAAQSLVEMQGKYIDHTMGRLGPLFVFCASVLDPVRRTDGTTLNPEVMRSCLKFLNDFEAAAIQKYVGPVQPQPLSPSSNRPNSRR